ncbi:hypothetical protein LQ327_12820 [Actinomycetospora endophytica]|uniref:Secreted protein n=1 Tax=Actinomycetospora endophytica TaxID=2291215 RepID=A0ABS8P7N9_9PSEU|nr:hypothetical protein [Actinomycetospora endophytica]MCD2194258.1 hypothetical protein [Actinomycetospora endophytica]
MLLKKAGMVVLAAGAGMVALTPAAFAGDMPQSSDSGDSGHSWGGDHGGKDHGHWGHGSGNHKSASSCDNGANQLNASKNGSLVGVLDGSQVAAPINACHILDDNNILNNVGIDVL